VTVNHLVEETAQDELVGFGSRGHVEILQHSLMQVLIKVTEQSPARRAAWVTPAPSVKVKNAKLRAARYVALQGRQNWRA